MITDHALPGMHLGFSRTYTNDEGILRRRTDWLVCSSYDHTTNVASGIHLHSGEFIKVHRDLIHTACSPFEHT
jgi:hypothetical protein